MKTRREMIEDAVGLVCDSERQLVMVVAYHPDRAPTARVVLADAVRAHTLLSSRAPWRKIAPELAARLKRASLLTEALQRPVQ